MEKKLILSVFITLLIAYMYYLSPKGNNINQPIVNNSVEQTTDSFKTLTIKNNYQETPLDNGDTLYKNIDFGFSIQYPKVTRVRRCSEAPCFSTENPNIAFSAVTEEFYDDIDQMNKLLDSDYICNAGGPTGEKICTNDNFEAYTNKNNEKGYILYRNVKISTVEGFYESKDRAYIFPIKKTQTNSNYKSILIYTHEPIEKNLEALDQVANSYTTY